MTEDRWLSDLHWRRESRQTRGEKTQAALLDAAEELIVEKGLEGTSIADVAKRAGSSVGSVYHHFKDKRALLYALFHRMTQAVADQSKQAADPARWDGASVRDLVEGYVDFRLQQRREVGVSKAATALVMANDPELKSYMAKIKLEGSQALLALILDRRSEIRHPNPEFATRFVIDQINAMLYALSDPYQKVSALADVDDDAFKREIVTWAETILGLRAQ